MGGILTVYIRPGETLEIVLSGAVATNELSWDVDIVAAKGDASSPAKIADIRMPTSAHGTTNGTTPVTMVSTPASGYVYRVRRISVPMADTAPVHVKIQKNFSGTRVIMWEEDLYPGDAPIFYGS